ncbi:MAG: superoxide dismutase [Bacteroidota bacterium]|nr:superoxide dismutase [Bacteroidota bacterium]
MAFTLPALPYLKESLEPFIDVMTMEIHHGKHHNAYVTTLNKAIENSDADKMSIEDILKNISKYPVTVRNNAGGHYNHSMFWTLLRPNGGGNPNGKLGNEIHSAFDSFDEFKKQFTESATNRFGSGWAWLIKNESGKLEICSTPNQDNPLMDIAEKKGIPILGLDVWEHAYYLKYQNRRSEYIEAWWNIVNWDEASNRFSQVQKKEQKNTQIK